MQAKYKIDRNTRTLILKYIQKYDEYVLWYKSERSHILSCAAEPKRRSATGDGGLPEDSTASTAERLEQLENHHRVKIIKAIDGAKLQIGLDIKSESALLSLRRAIWLSCLNSREYNFEAFAGMICCERRQFYRYKNEFLNNIKKSIGL